MTQQTHTPGPWQWHHDGGNHADITASANTGSPPWWSNDPASVHGDTPEEARANARLIAAASTSYDKHCGANAVAAAEGDLLGEALEACRAAYDYFGLPNYPDGEAELPKRLRAVLSKVWR